MPQRLEQYCGYSIEIAPKDAGWRVWARPNTPNLPILRQDPFDSDAPSEAEAFAEAKRQIDSLLWG
jgi:hypothetical protein